MFSYKQAKKHKALSEASKQTDRETNTNKHTESRGIQVYIRSNADSYEDACCFKYSNKHRFWKRSRNEHLITKLLLAVMELTLKPDKTFEPTINEARSHILRLPSIQRLIDVVFRVHGSAKNRLSKCREVSCIGQSVRPMHIRSRFVHGNIKWCSTHSNGQR